MPTTTTQTGFNTVLPPVAPGANPVTAEAKRLAASQKKAAAEQAKKIAASLAEKNTAPVAKLDPKLVAVRKTVLDTFKPTTKTLTEAEASAVAAYRDAAGTEETLAATAVCGLALAMADVAFYRLTGDDPLIPGEKTWTELVRHCDNIAATKEITPQKKELDDGRVIVLEHTRLASRVSGSTKRRAAMRALLLAAGKVTGVTIGFLAAEPSRVALGKTTEWQSKMPKVTGGPVLRGVCAPRSVLYMDQVQKGLKSGKPVMEWRPSDDTTLAFLNDPWAEATYAIHFGLKPAVYQTESPAVGQYATGELVLPATPRKGSSGTGAQAGAANAAAAGAKDNDPVTIITALFSRLSETAKPGVAPTLKPIPQWQTAKPLIACAAVAQLAAEMVDRVYRDSGLHGKTCPEQLDAAIIELRSFLNTIIVDDKQGEPWLIGTDGTTRIRKLAQTGSLPLSAPKPELAKAATKGKAVAA